MKSQWWNRLVSKKSRVAALRRGRQLLLEQLEVRCQPSVVPVGVYSPIDEVGNNATNSNWGAAPADQGRGAHSAAADLSHRLHGWGQHALADLRQGCRSRYHSSPRTISNDVFNQSPSLFGSPSTDINTVDGNGLSDFGYSFGQFMDHDMDLTPDQGGFLSLRATRLRTRTATTVSPSPWTLPIRAIRSGPWPSAAPCLTRPPKPPSQSQAPAGRVAWQPSPRRTRSLLASWWPSTAWCRPAITAPAPPSSTA